jgi:hypothetical protein
MQHTSLLSEELHDVICQDQRETNVMLLATVNGKEIFTVGELSLDTTIFWINHIKLKVKGKVVPVLN